MSQIYSFQTVIATVFPIISVRVFLFFFVILQIAENVVSAVFFRTIFV